MTERASDFRPLHLPPTLVAAPARTPHPEIAERLPAWWSGAWWHRSAAEAVLLGRWQEIVDQRSGALYLARFWLSPPLEGAGRGEVPESASSCLLHWIVRPDPDDAFHDHPWDFTSVILSGGYREDRREADDKAWAYTVEQEAAARNLILRDATDLHRIVQVYGETWTLVKTGPRVREWGFMAAKSPQWVPYREFLARASGRSAGEARKGE